MGHVYNGSRRQGGKNPPLKSSHKMVTGSPVGSKSYNLHEIRRQTEGVKEIIRLFVVQN